MSRVGIGLLNTWVSNNKLTLIEQLDSFLLCAGLKKKKNPDPDRIKINLAW